MLDHNDRRIHIVSSRASLAFLAIIALVFTLALTGCESRKTAGGNNSTSAGILYPEPLTGESIRQVIASSMGDSSHLRDATLSGEGQNRTVDVGVDRPTTCEDGSVEATMAVLDQKIMPVLFEYPEVSRVTLTIYGIRQAVKSDDIAIKTSVTRESASEIDWSFFGPMTMSSMVTDYYIDPEILRNSSSVNDGMSMYH